MIDWSACLRLTDGLAPVYTVSVVLVTPAELTSLHFHSQLTLLCFWQCRVYQCCSGIENNQARVVRYEA